jgi:2-oxo-4-hydroxy-4-carboxy-5-ureidoimidazoline decarboxylase
MSAKAMRHINALDRADFIALLGGLYEHSPWAAERALAARPFREESALAGALAGAVNSASADEKLALIRAHPELAGEKLRARGLTESSMSEQKSVGLDRLDADEIARWTKLNAAYRERFGFPFIIRVRLHTKEQILSVLEKRLARSPDAETAEAIRQIHDIARLRLADVVTKLDAA